MNLSKLTAKETAFTVSVFETTSIYKTIGRDSKPHLIKSFNNIFSRYIFSP